MALTANQILALNAFSRAQPELAFGTHGNGRSYLLYGEDIDLGTVLSALQSGAGGDPLPTNVADGFLKRNSGNTAWEEVAYGTAANTVAQGNDSRIVNAIQNTGGAISGQLSLTPASTLTPSGTTQTINWNNGQNAVLSLASASGDVTLTLTNPISGTTYTVSVTQGSTARNIVWPNTVKWAFGLVPTISTTNGALDLITLYYNGTNYLGSFNQAYA